MLQRGCQGSRGSVGVPQKPLRPQHRSKGLTTCCVQGRRPGKVSSSAHINEALQDRHFGNDALCGDSRGPEMKPKQLDLRRPLSLSPPSFVFILERRLLSPCVCTVWADGGGTSHLVLVGEERAAWTRGRETRSTWKSQSRSGKHQCSTVMGTVLHGPRAGQAAARTEGHAALDSQPTRSPPRTWDFTKATAGSRRGAGGRREELKQEEFPLLTGFYFKRDGNLCNRLVEA